MIKQEDIDNWFSYHKPTDVQQQKYKDIRSMAGDFAVLLNHLLPDCADKTVVFRKLRELVMVANQTIDCNSNPINAVVPNDGMKYHGGDPANNF